MFPTRRITTGGGDVFRDEFSLAFDGTNDNIRISDVTVDTDGACAIVFWAKYAGGGSSPWCVLGNTSDSNSKHLRFVGTDDLKWENDTTDEEAVINLPIAFTDQQWHHYVVVSNSGTVTAYQDGVACTIAGDNLSSSNCTFNSIGGQGTNGVVYEYKGNISEIAIYNKALSASEAKTLYNGREPYNHKEGVCSSNLQAWWRMGDGVIDSFPIVQDQVNTNIGSNLVSNPSFDTNTTGWEQYAGGSGDDNVISRETSITRSGSGSLKIVYAAGNGGWGARLSGDAITGTANKLMLMEGYVYIPSGAYNGGSPTIHDGAAFGATGTTSVVADVNITDQWQYVRTVHILDSSDLAGTIFLHTTGTDPSAGDILYWDDISVRMLEGNAGQMFNMTASDFKGDTP